MSLFLQKEFDKLKKTMLTLCALVEEDVQKAAKSVAERDASLAGQVIRQDVTVDQMEVEVEEECLKILALHQPVAADLRFVIAVLKLNNDLERIGDMAVNIAEQAQALAGQAPIEIPFDLTGMVKKAQAMLRKSLDALINRDEVLAREVLAADDEVDAIHRQMYGLVGKQVQAKPERTEALLRLLSVSRSVERIADNATNIAEDVIYLVQGQIVRHGGGETKPGA